MSVNPVDLSTSTSIEIEEEDYDPEQKPAWDPRLVYPDEWKHFVNERKLSAFSRAELETISEVDSRAESKMRRFFGLATDDHQRSDHTIREDVIRHLDGKGIDLSEVVIEVKDGELTLRGRIDSFQQKRSMEDVCETVLGIRSVTNLLLPKKIS